MQLFKNTDAHPRVWSHIQDPRTGTTLILFPDDVIELDPEILGEGFDDPHLRPLSPEEAQAHRDAQAAKEAAAAQEAAAAEQAAKSKKGAKAPDALEAATAEAAEAPKESE